MPEIFECPYLNTDGARIVLSKHSVPTGDKAFALRQFLIENEALRDDVYRAYVQVLPKPFTKIPENLGTIKLKIDLNSHSNTIESFDRMWPTFRAHYHDAHYPSTLGVTQVAEVMNEMIHPSKRP